MIEGTRNYRRKNLDASVDEKAGTESPVELASNSAGPPRAHATEPAQSAHSIDEDSRRGEESLGRRAWFSALVPALGEGLVKILRASNNLKDDLGLRR